MILYSIFRFLEYIFLNIAQILYSHKAGIEQKQQKKNLYLYIDVVMQKMNDSTHKIRVCLPTLEIEYWKTVRCYTRTLFSQTNSSSSYIIVLMLRIFASVL